MQKASDIVLTGCSGTIASHVGYHGQHFSCSFVDLAGGLSVYLHADFIQTMVNRHAKYRAFADAG